MKMNKIFSLAVATVMSFSLFSAFTVNAAVVNDQKVIDVEVAESYTSDGFDVYVVDFVATNLEFTGEKVTSGPRKAYKGRGVAGFTLQFKLSVDGKNNTLDSESFVLREASAFSVDEPMISDAKDLVTIPLGGSESRFPTADNVAIKATDRTSLYTAQIWIPEGSTAVMTFTDECAINTLYFDGFNGASTDDSSYLNYKGIGCVTKSSVTLGEVAEEPTTNEQYFYATVEAIKHNYLEFQFDSNDDDKADKGYHYKVGSLSIGENDSLTVGLQYTGTQTLKLIDVIWSDECKNIIN